MSEHTPGPWIAVERDAPERPVRCMPRISVGQPVESGGPSFEQCVAWIVPRRFGGSQHEADARLIAAAPDMLMALESFTDSMDMLDLDRARADARAAIAKARGRS